MLCSHGTYILTSSSATVNLQAVVPGDATLVFPVNAGARAADSAVVVTVGNVVVLVASPITDPAGVASYLGIDAFEIADPARVVTVNASARAVVTPVVIATGSVFLLSHQPPPIKDRIQRRRASMVTA